MYDILTFGASIDELNTEAIQQAIDAAASAGGGTVVVPAGEFLTGNCTAQMGGMQIITQTGRKAELEALIAQM